jgi:hypothetical protein
MDLSTRAHRIHDRLLQRIAAAEWVLYEGAGVTVRCKAVRGQTSPQSVAAGGEVVVGKQLIDWLIITDEFVTAAGAAVIPIEGCTITPESEDAIYEVVTGPSGQCYKPANGRGLRMRIHTDRTVASE